jgi:hypothetical protein
MRSSPHGTCDELSAGRRYASVLGASCAVDNPAVVSGGSPLLQRASARSGACSLPLPRNQRVLCRTPENDRPLPTQGLLVRGDAP